MVIYELSLDWWRIRKFIHHFHRVSFLCVPLIYSVLKIVEEITYEILETFRFSYRPNII